MASHDVRNLKIRADTYAPIINWSKLLCMSVALSLRCAGEKLWRLPVALCQVQNWSKFVSVKLTWSSCGNHVHLKGGLRLAAAFRIFYEDLCLSRFLRLRSRLDCLVLVASSPIRKLIAF